MPANLSDSLVRSLEAPASGNKITWDGKLTGFGCRVTAKGAKAFILNYRNRFGTERRHTIGAYPDWSVAAARAEAKEIKKAVDRGEDPVADKKALRAAPAMSDLCDRYEHEHLPKKRPRSRENDKALIRRFIRPKLGNIKVAEVQFSDVDSLHRSLRAG